MVPPRKSMVIDLDSSSDESNAVQNRRPVIASSSSSSSGSSSSSSSQAARQPPTSASAPAPTLVIRHKPQASQGSRPNGASRNSNERMRNSLQSQRANFSVNSLFEKNAPNKSQCADLPFFPTFGSNQTTPPEASGKVSSLEDRRLRL